MGVFSWLTADTEESVAIGGTSHINAGRTVYLLNPDGVAPICERDYAGYGIFGGVDAFVWLVEQSFDVNPLSALSLELVHTLGIRSDGRYFTDSDGQRWIYCPETELHAPLSTLPGFTSVKFFTGNFDIPLPERGISPNDLLGSGEWVISPMTPKYPLKFSFSEKACYEELPASAVCPDQGFFYY